VKAAVIRRLLAALLLPVLLYACLGPSFRLEDLPPEPIALVHRTREESENRAELLARAKEKPIRRPPGQNFFRLEDVGDFLGLGRTREEKQADFLGRMALLDARSGEVERLDFVSRGARPLVWSPDHRFLLFQAPVSPVLQAPAAGDRQHVFEYDRETGEVRPIARGVQYYTGASYGSDGRLALARIDPRERPQARSRIFVTRPGGGSPRALTPGPRDSWPVWSPDGSVLIYSSLDDAGNEVIRAIDPLAGGKSKIIARGVEGAFFPDGKWVVYSAKRRGRWAIWRVRPDGSGKHPIGSSRGDERDPSVSPDGRFIVYVSEADEYQRLMVRPLDGSGDRPLLKEGDGLLPAW
jgi:Tol biopolymer transport system component